MAAHTGGVGRAKVCSTKSRSSEKDVLKMVSGGENPGKQVFVLQASACGRR
jgi:hypothetical protein